MARANGSRFETVIDIGKPANFTGGLEFTNLTYTVSKKKKVDRKWSSQEVDLLHRITGYAPKGCITAVMGLVVPESLRSWMDWLGVSRVEASRDDRLFPMLTVYETLMFAADFRLGPISTADKKQRVEKLIEQLGLSFSRNTYIGDEGNRGVSGGERRRVSIGVDIIHGPSLLFLDEPTSGLDSTSAHSVIEKVHNIARSGSTVILTIHQPSSRIQLLLDHLIILARGQLMYRGSPKDVTLHLSQMGRKVPKGENSIEYLIDVIQEYDQSEHGVEALAQFLLNGTKPPKLSDEDVSVSTVAPTPPPPYGTTVSRKDQSGVYAAIVWKALKLQGPFSYFLLVLYVSLLSTNSFVVFVSSVVPNFILGYAAVIAFTALFFLFCGYFLNSHDIPMYWKWMNKISTMTYPYEGLLMNQYRTSDIFGYAPNGDPISGNSILKSLNISTQESKKWEKVLVMLGWAVLYRIFFYIILRFFSKNQREKLLVLKLVSRIDVGNAVDDIRYPDDYSDRIWEKLDNNTVLISPDPTPATSNILNDSTKVFNIYINNEIHQKEFDIQANGSHYNVVELNVTAKGSLNLTLVKVTNRSVFGPILNAYEILQVYPWIQGTNQQDVDTIKMVRDELLSHNKENQLLQSWSGDPCLPLPWKGLTCQPMNGAKVITSLDISSSHLRGKLPANITRMNNLMQLNVSNNEFTGKIPEFPSYSKLTSVDLSHNELDGSLPNSLTSLPNLTILQKFMAMGNFDVKLLPMTKREAAKRKTLDWPTRLSIALGAARGLTHLHTFSGRCIIHRDVKSSNILLDQSMNAKVADFGFSKYAPQEGDSGASLEVRGTAGYLDPEYYSTQHLSAKSDVFSFGVVLLEIVSAREPLNIHRPRNEWSLVEWAKPFIRESKIDEIVDPSIKGAYHAEAMWRVVEAALACIEPFSAYRPCMADIVRELEDALIIENNASEYMKSIDSIGGTAWEVPIASR
ncbi:hypothetical protein GH714_016539 [Hevea brasiliensis]|uniref:Protein kinase domain-containing protein n=1 Tax=Hevea brasiliensis TaxID=3981 RepID=A0A6A6K5P8_HEVBR|nr:hypothetical protein GH714_016539 [Hevea brasiliensis]